MAIKIRKWHVWTVVGIALLSVADALYLKNAAGKGLGETLHSAVQVAVLLIIAELIIILILEQDEFTHYARRAIESSETSLAYFERMVEKDDTLIGRLGREAARKFFQTYEIRPPRCKVEGQHEAINSYVVFWQYMVERQKKEKKAIRVHAVHSLSIDIWNNEKMVNVLEKQGEFIKQGGEVTRIFISSEEEPDASYLRVIKEMTAKNISVYFARRSEFDHDFIVIPSLQMAVIWSSTVIGRKMQGAEYIVNLSEDQKEALVSRWEEAKSGAVDGKSIEGKLSR